MHLAFRRFALLVLVAMSAFLALVHGAFTAGDLLACDWLNGGFGAFMAWSCGYVCLSCVRTDARSGVSEHAS